jgi:carbon monoxide dehydrogenase subunit G
MNDDHLYWEKDGCMKNLLMLVLLGVLYVPAYANNPHEDIEVKVHLEGDDMLVDANFAVPASTRQVWDVLTDFDHMAGFISNLRSSKVIGGSDTVVQVSQKGVAKHAMMTFRFESVREMHLFPYEKILSHMVSGTIRKMEGETQLIGEGDQTRVVYHADVVPGVWIPPMLGKMFIEHETREQFQEIRDEILKRK